MSENEHVKDELETPGAGDPELINDAPDGVSAHELAPESDPAAESMADGANRVEALEAQVADLNDRLLRAMAETENVRRRAQRDKEDASKYAIKGFAEQMVTVSDNLCRALQSVDAGARASDPALDSIVVGVEMVERELQNGFERFGITAIKALGHKFDPMLHEAMFEIEDPQTPAGTIAQVLEVGYMLHDRTLRAAKVGITRGGPKSVPTADSTPDGDESAAADPLREGQARYESKGAEPGSQVDQEL